MTPRRAAAAPADTRTHGPARARHAAIAAVIAAVIAAGAAAALLGAAEARDRPPLSGAGAGAGAVAGAVAAVPEGMVYVPGGETRIGAEDGLPHERPVFRARVRPFFMDVHPVTVSKFAAFVEATGYVTDAERFGGGAVLHAAGGRWVIEEGATWRHPLGPAGPAAEGDHPVTQVSWNDAAAYAEWAGKRLPTEIEWEHAARNARDDRRPYAWGDSLVVEGAHRANTWQGHFPSRNTGEDGWPTTSRVGSFGITPLGLADMGGNVWEWTASWYRSYAERDRAFAPTARSERVQRGGSFLCHVSYCHGYRVSARSHSTPETSLFHVGFRLARDIVAE